MRTLLLCFVLVFTLCIPVYGQPTDMLRMASAAEAAFNQEMPVVPSSVVIRRADARRHNHAPAAPELMEGGKRYGVGMGGTWLAYGLSGTYDLSEQLTGEAILGVFGALTSVGGRAWYRFNQAETYDVYAYAAASMYRYGYRVLGDDLSETAFGAGGGVGLQASLPKLFKNPDFPPISVNVDVGLGFASFDVYGFSSFTGGSGLHYRF